MAAVMMASKSLSVSTRGVPMEDARQYNSASHSRSSKTLHGLIHRGAEGDGAVILHHGGVPALERFDDILSQLLRTKGRIGLPFGERLRVPSSCSAVLVTRRDNTRVQWRPSHGRGVMARALVAA